MLQFYVASTAARSSKVSLRKRGYAFRQDLRRARAYGEHCVNTALTALLYLRTVGYDAVDTLSVSLCERVTLR